MSTSAKVWAAVILAVLGLLSTLASREHQHSKTIESLTQGLRTASTQASTLTLENKSLRVQIQQQIHQLQEKDEKIRVASETVKHFTSFRAPDGSVRTSWDSEVNRSSETTRHQVDELTSQLQVLEAQVGSLQSTATSATAEVDRLTQQLRQRDVETGKSSPHLELDADLATTMAASRLGLGAVFGGLTVGAGFAPLGLVEGWPNWNAAAPMLHVGLRL